MEMKSEEGKSGGGEEMQSSKGENSRVKKTKRVSRVELLKSEVKVDDLRDELEGLFSYHRELLDEKMDFGPRGSASINSAVACLLEESRLPFSKLVSDIYQKLKETEDGITLASVKSLVHLIANRLPYGLTVLDADLFEDENDSYCWCWEAKDVKLLPMSLRGMIKNRRSCRKKIHERITAVSGMISALEKSEALQSPGQELKKASERLNKVLNEADIRSLVQTLVEKNSADMTETQVKTERKKLIKEMEKNKREEEKEEKKRNQELLKEKSQTEKEMKRLQSEERKRQKEEAENRKQLKRKQEDMEKDQRRREMEETELKNKKMLQKQASLMDRFFKRSKTNSTSLNNQSASIKISFDSFRNKENTISESVTLAMDHILLKKDEMNFDDILKRHFLAWRSFGRTNSSRKQHWGMRQKPKSEVIKETKLSTGKKLVGEDELNLEKLDGVWDETHSDGRLGNSTMPNSSVPCSQKPKRHKQLLQFDKSNRPAFYGIWTKKSQHIRPRHPFKKDPDLYYEIDSDKEWEEEEPGESLSDFDNDVEDEILEEGCLKADCEEDSEDDFFVPDGYLSENEGIEMGRRESGCLMNEADGLSHCKMDPENEQKMYLLLRQQKYMQNLTDHALKKNQPFIISNIKHEKASIMMAEDLTGTSKLEQLSLQALSICQFSGSLCCISSVEDKLVKGDENSGLSKNKESATKSSTDMPALSDLELREIVSTIQPCQDGRKKLLESLQQKFPSIPKSQLKTKVCEISDFVDNPWQVKRDVLNKLGFSSSSASSSGRTKSIADFFSKQSLPADAEEGKNIESNINSSM